MELKNYHRSKILINKKLQFKYVLINTLFLLLFALIISFGVYITTWHSVVKEFSSVHLAEDLETITRLREYEGVRQRHMVEIIPMLKEEAKMLSEQQKKVLSNIILNSNIRLMHFFIVALIFIFVISLIYSHRIAGPLHRLIHNLNEIRNGNLIQNFKLRQKDELKDVANVIDNLSKDFYTTVNNTKELIENLKNSKTEEERKEIISKLEKIYSVYEKKS